MAIDDKSIKKLWGMAAGRCSKPGCNEECLKFFNSTGTVIGEMAHVIAQSEKGPRGVAGGGSDDYENLILLCPTHHTTIDKAPEGTFPAEVLFGWKKSHEERVRKSLEIDDCVSFDDAVKEIDHLLEDNYYTWKEYGPRSERAQTNPLSNIAEHWEMRKLSQIVPNNTRICNLLEKFRSNFSRDERHACRQFLDHATAFEKHCYSPMEDYNQFPPSFREMIEERCRVSTIGASATAQ